MRKDMVIAAAGDIAIELRDRAFLPENEPDPACFSRRFLPREDPAYAEAMERDHCRWPWPEGEDTAKLIGLASCLFCGPRITGPGDTWNEFLINHRAEFIVELRLAQHAALQILRERWEKLLRIPEAMQRAGASGLTAEELIRNCIDSLRS
jgi:hypothetical protein